VIDTDVSVISCRRPDGLRCRFYISEIRNHLGVTSRCDVTSRFSLSRMKYATVGPCPGGETKLQFHCRSCLRRSAERFYSFQSLNCKQSTRTEGRHFPNAFVIASDFDFCRNVTYAQWKNIVYRPKLPNRDTSVC
jgi:hypothetical protein